MLGSPRMTSRRSSKMEPTLTKLAIMTASARVDLQVTTRRRHEFQCLLDLAQKITARPIIAATTVKLVFLRMWRRVSSARRTALAPVWSNQDIPKVLRHSCAGDDLDCSSTCIASGRRHQACIRVRVLPASQAFAQQRSQMRPPRCCSCTDHFQHL